MHNTLGKSPLKVDVQRWLNPSQHVSVQGQEQNELHLFCNWRPNETSLYDDASTVDMRKGLVVVKEDLPQIFPRY